MTSNFYIPLEHFLDSLTVFFFRVTNKLYQEMSNKVANKKYFIRKWLVRYMSKVIKNNILINYLTCDVYSSLRSEKYYIIFEDLQQFFRP